MLLVDDNPEDAVSDRIRAAAASARATAPQPPSSSEPGTPIRKETVVTNDAPTAAVDERLGAPEPEVTAPAAAATAAQPINPVAGLPEGLVAIDANLLEELRSNARAGAEARAEQDRARRDGIIATAIAEGRIAPTSRDHFRSMLDENETATAAALASLQPNTALPVEEVGHAVGEAQAEDAYPAHWKR